MNGIKPDIEQTDDGSATLRHPVFGDTYHSTRGAVGESQHVFIANGIATVGRPIVRILEVGFGSGLNAWQSLCYGRENGIGIDYTAIELYPVDLATASALGYTSDPSFMEMHAAAWEVKYRLTDSFCITKLAEDITVGESVYNGKYRNTDNCSNTKEVGKITIGGSDESDYHTAGGSFAWNKKCDQTEERQSTEEYSTEYKKTGSAWRDSIYDIIYFDAFAPDTQPEMWNPDIFRRLYGVLEIGGTLVTYSAKGSVKQALRDAGFIVRRLPGALGKRHMLRAEKQAVGETSEAVV